LGGGTSAKKKRERREKKRGGFWGHSDNGAGEKKGQGKQEGKGKKAEKIEILNIGARRKGEGRDVRPGRVLIRKTKKSGQKAGKRKGGWGLGVADPEKKI